MWRFALRYGFPDWQFEQKNVKQLVSEVIDRHDGV